jgi:non-homologous end joining protein Ku
VGPSDESPEAITNIGEAPHICAASPDSRRYRPRDAWIGEIAFSGREHLVAIGAPLDFKQKGLMLYLLRYEDELREPKPALSGVKDSSCKATTTSNNKSKSPIKEKLTTKP